MAIPRVDISQEIADWQAAVYGEEVRSANVSALTKLQTQMNAACDGIEDAETDVATAVNTANAASTTANQASSAAQTAIATANAAITTAQGYAANAEGSAQNAAASATAAQTAQTGAQTAQLAAEAAEQAAEDAAQQAQIAINITPDEETIHHADDVVGTISTITYTLEEIAAMTDASGKVPDASAVKSLKDALTNLGALKKKAYSYTYSLPANASLSITASMFGYTATSGEEPIGYIYINPSSTSSDVVIKYFSLPSYSQTMLVIKNTYNGAVNNSTATVAILFAPVTVTSA